MGVKAGLVADGSWSSLSQPRLEALQFLRRSGRSRGDLGEIQGRSRGDLREIQGRSRGDLGEILSLARRVTLQFLRRLGLGLG
jgi:hypothetical protein